MCTDGELKLSIQLLDLVERDLLSTFVALLRCDRLRADLPRSGQASRACARPTVRRSTIEDVHGIIDQHYEEQRVAAVTRLIEELERIAEERAGHTGLYDKAKSKREKIEERFQSEILYEAEFLKHTIAELETRQVLRRAVAKKRSDEQFRPFE